MRSLTSGSNIYRRAKCPGSQHAEAEILDDGGNDASDEGTLLHPFAINRSLSRAHLTEKQRQLLDIADHGTKSFLSVADIMFRQAPRDDRPKWSETTLVLRGPDGEGLFDSTPDEFYSYHEADAVAVQDFKMGFVEVTKAEGNYQLASYAVMCSDFTGAHSALVAINQPRAKERLTTAFYDWPAIEAARKELAAIYHAAQHPDAPRIAGESQCTFCKAKLHCDEYKRKFRALEIAPDSKSVKTVDNEQLIRLAEAVKFASRIEDAVMSEMRRRIEDGELTDWYLKENGETRELTDIVGAYQELTTYFSAMEGFDGSKFSNCMTMSWTKLTALFREITGFSQRKARAVLLDVLSPYITSKPKQPTPTPKE